MLYILALFTFLGGQPSVNKIEPPSWWTHFKDKNLEILVYGKNLSSLNNAKVFDKKNKIVKSIKTKIIGISDNGNYLFLNIGIGRSLKPGDYVFTLTNGSNEKVSFNYRFKAQQKNRNYAQGFNSSDVVYLLMPDRFANGDKENDNVKGLLAGTNRAEPGERHGGDLKGIIERLSYLEELGITAIWTTPVFENDMPRIVGEYDGHVYGSYHGYAATDFYTIDRRFGTNQDYKSLVEEAHKSGIKVIMDVVHNHVGDKHPWFSDPPNSTWFNNNDKFSVTNYETGVNNDLYASDFDLSQLTNAPFVPEMPDLNQIDPRVSRYLIQHSLWWIEYSGIDGIRMDTYPYASKAHLSNWCKALLDEFPNFGIVGEIWHNRPGTVAYWQDGFDTYDGYQSNLQSVIDFPLSHSIASAFQRGSKPVDIRKIYDILTQDIIYPDPKSNFIFLDNHDSDRFFNIVGEDIRKYKIGIALILTLRGVPQFYYGTEINLTGKRSRGDAFVRKDFPGGWIGDKNNAFIQSGRSQAQNEIWNFCSKLLNWRKKNDVIHNGKTKHFSPHQPHNTYAIFRYDDKKTVGLFINPNSYDVELKTYRYEEIIDQGKDYYDVIGEKIFKMQDTLKVKGMSFRLIEIETSS